jgi:hypothetical protein
MTSLDKLNVSQLPPHEAFYSTLKNENISAEDYQLCQTVADVDKLQLLCLDTHEIVVPLHGILDLVTVHQSSKQIWTPTFS